MANKGSYTCIFGGGAIRGLAYIGAIKALNELDINIDVYAGSSVGSIIAGFLAVGYSVDEISELLMQVKFELFRDISFGFNKDFALSKGNVFTEWVRECIEKKFYGEDYKKGENSPVLFKDLSNKLVVMTTDLNKFKPYELSTFETPEFEVATAIRISCSMPGLMTPVEIDDKKLVDGDLLKGVPAWKHSKNLNHNKNRVLEFRLEGETISQTNHTFDFVNSIYSCMTSAPTDFIIDVYGKNDRYDYVKITTGDIIVIDFNLPMKTRNKIVDIGYNQSIKYLTKDAVFKKKRIVEYYTKILRYLKELSKNISQNNVSDTKELFKEMFLYLSDVFSYIDIDIYEGLRTLKNDVFSASLKSGWFKSQKFRNTDNFKKNADVLTKVISAKKDELVEYINNVEG